MTNCYIVSGDERTCVVIDPADDGKEIFNEITSLGLTLEAILLTHGHFDHIYGLPQLLTACGNKDLPIYINKNEANFLSDMSYNLSKSLFNVPFTFNGNIVAFSDGDTLELSGLSFKVISTPGHTPGSSCFITENNIFSGDTLFASTIGRTDFPGGDYDTLINSLEKFKALSGEYYIYPGHNASTTLSREKSCNEFMKL